MPLAQTPTSVPVVVDEEKCIADKGCTVRVDVSPLITHDNIALFQRVQRREFHPTTTPDDFN